MQGINIRGAHYYETILLSTFSQSLNDLILP